MPPPLADSMAQSPWQCQPGQGRRNLSCCQRAFSSSFKTIRAAVRDWDGGRRGTGDGTLDLPPAEFSPDSGKGCMYPDGLPQVKRGLDPFLLPIKCRQPKRFKGAPLSGSSLPSLHAQHEKQRRGAGTKTGSGTQPFLCLSFPHVQRGTRPTHLRPLFQIADGCLFQPRGTTRRQGCPRLSGVLNGSNHPPLPTSGP